MGQGSRGGNSGLTSSGERKRQDKDKTAPRDRIGQDGKNGGKGGNSRRNAGGGGGGGGGGAGGRGGRGRGRGIGLLHGLGGLHGLGTGGRSGSGSGSGGTGKTVTPPRQSQAVKMPKIRRTKPLKVKLTRQRTNKTPN